MTAVRTIIGHGHRLFRESVAATLAMEPNIDLVDVVDDGARAVRTCQLMHPDVALLSIDLPPSSGIAACGEILDATPAVKVVLMGPLGDGGTLVSAFEAGALGFIDTGYRFQQVPETLERIRSGEIVVPPNALGSLLRGLIDRRRAAAEALQAYVDLTPREREVLMFLANGLDHDAIAERLFISPATARTHIQNVIRKLGVHSRVEAAALAHEQGWTALSVRNAAC